MKTFAVILAGVAAASLFLAPRAPASTTSVSSLQKQVADAQKQVDQAQADFDEAKKKAEAGMSSSGKNEWRSAEAKLDSLMDKGADSKKISAQKETVIEIESRVMQRSDREKVDNTRNALARAQAKLDQAKTELRVAKAKNNDDSSQAIQPENRTQNGSNFSIRSQRDSENHPPLPASQ